MKLLVVLFAACLVAIGTGFGSREKTVRFEISDNVEVRAMASCEGSGDVVVVGTAMKPEGEDLDYFTAKISGGNLKVKWQDMHGSSEEDVFNSVSCDGQGVVTAVGYTRGSTKTRNPVKDKDFALVQFDPEGKVTFRDETGSADADEFGSAIKVTKWGTLLVGGTSHGRVWNGKPGLLMLEYDRVIDPGRVIPERWGRNLGGILPNEGVFLDSNSDDGAHYILGNNPEKKKGALLMKVSDRKVAWSFRLTHTSAEVTATDVATDFNSLPVVMTTRVLPDKATETWFTKISTTGIMLWERKIGSVSSMADGLFFANNRHFFVHALEENTEKVLEFNALGVKQHDSLTVNQQGRLPNSKYGFTLDESQSRMVMYRSVDSSSLTVVRNNIAGFRPFKPQRVPQVQLEFSLRAELGGQITVQKASKALEDIMLDMWQIARTREMRSVWKEVNEEMHLQVRLSVSTSDRALFYRRIKKFSGDKRVLDLVPVANLRLADSVVDNCAIVPGCNMALPDVSQGKLNLDFLQQTWTLIIVGCCCGLVLAIAASSLTIVVLSGSKGGYLKKGRSKKQVMSDIFDTRSAEQKPESPLLKDHDHDDDNC
mmetsp:Transcript_3428/g.10407  ORF Transcript_3428/g.10407 Transcript_3428/m.10407 type:complete len:597 (-) Transcript_3428:189-1979(-)